MMAEAIVNEARRWIGTPYRHQCATRGAGCDCLGLVLGVWRAQIGPLSEPVPPYSRDWSEPQGAERLWQAAMRHLTPLAQDASWGAGQVLLFRMREGAVAKHLGILSDSDPESLRFIHAYSRRGVVQSALSDPWRRRVVARFEFPVS